MEILVAGGTIGVTAAVVIYLILRMFVWSKAESKSLERIRKHALWTGVLAWAFSSVAGASRAGLYSAMQTSDAIDSTIVVHVDPWSTIPVSWLIAPVVAALLAHLIGQLSWPTPKSPRRTAVLEFRRVRDYVEPALGWTVLGIFLLSVGALVWLAFAPAFPARMSGQDSGGLYLLPRDGRIAGWILASALGVSLAILAAGTLLIMRLIASRRSLEALTAEQNTTLRIIGMNRLLRVSATMASGLAAIAGNYLVQPAPDSTATSWTNWLALVNMVVLITILVWKPPALQPLSPLTTVPGMDSTPRSRETVRVARFLGSTVRVLASAAAVGALVGFMLRNWLGSMGFVTSALLFMVLAYLALEMALTHKYAASRSGTRFPLPKPLPWYLYAGFGLSASALAAAVLYARNVSGGGIPRKWDGYPSSAAIYVVPCLLAIIILLVGLLTVWFVYARPAVDGVPAMFDASLRRRSLFRIARTVTSCWFALAGLLLSMAAPPASMNPLDPQFNPTLLGSLALALAAITLFLPVRSFASEDFTPRPTSSSLHK